MSTSTRTASGPVWPRGSNMQQRNLRKKRSFLYNHRKLNYRLILQVSNWVILLVMIEDSQVCILIKVGAKSAMPATAPSQTPCLSSWQQLSPRKTETASASSSASSSLPVIVSTPTTSHPTHFNRGERQDEGTPRVLSLSAVFLIVFLY